MDKKYIIGGIFGIFLAVFFIPFSIDAAIPPTPAIKTIASNDTTYTTTGGYFNSTNYAEHLWIITDGSILVEFVNYTGGVQ